MGRRRKLVPVTGDVVEGLARFSKAAGLSLTDAVELILSLVAASGHFNGFLPHSVLVGFGTGFNVVPLRVTSIGYMINDKLFREVFKSFISIIVNILKAYGVVGSELVLKLLRSLLPGASVEVVGRDIVIALRSPRPTFEDTLSLVVEIILEVVGLRASVVKKGGTVIVKF